MKFRTLLFISLFVLTEYQIHAQNLIPNGSFEDANTCTEADAECAPEAWKTTSPFLLGFAGDQSNRFVAFTIYNPSVPNTRQYLQIKLLCPLQKDINYKFSLRLKSFNLQIGSIAALYSDSIIFNNRDILINIRPTIDFSNQLSGIPKRNKGDWNKFEVIYQAKGFEKYLIIGNFQSDDDQKRTFSDKPKYFTNYYYGIDDIELVPIDRIELCPEYDKVKETLYNLNDRHPLRRLNLFGDDMKIEPLDVTEKPLIDTITLGNVLFAFDSYELTGKGYKLLDSIYKEISRKKIESINVYGHTDSIGDQQYNLRLSLNRANTIKEFLASKGLSSLLNDIQGFGDNYPKESNKNEIGRQYNRRVEIIIKYKQVSH